MDVPVIFCSLQMGLILRNMSCSTSSMVVTFTSYRIRSVLEKEKSLCEQEYRYIRVQRCRPTSQKNDLFIEKEGQERRQAGRHTRTHERMHTCTHARVHTHTHTHMHARARTLLFVSVGRVIVYLSHI